MEYTLDIEGSEFSNGTMVARILSAAACVALGTFLWQNAEPFKEPVSEHEMWGGFWAIICFGVALALPLKRHKYLDFTDRKMVTVVHYAWVRCSRRQQALDEFCRVVVRHVCHDGGEGPDTYTGSVGLKPADGTKPLWLKTFPTDDQEIPRETVEFATEVAELTGLPLDTGGCTVRG